MPAADDAFAGIGGHFTRETLCTLIAARRIEIARALLADAAEPALTSDSLLEAVRGGKIPSKRTQFNIGRRQINLEKLRVTRDDPVPASLLDQLIGQGATLVCNHVDRTFESLHGLATLIGGEFGVRVQITAVLSVTGRSGLNPHHDVADAFIVHLEGEKEWVMLGAPVREGLPQQGFFGEEGPARTVTLQAGDVMFLPVGQRHYCNPSPSGSLHLGILLLGTDGKDAGAALAESIAGDPDLLRRYLAFAHKATLPALADGYRARLHALVDELDLEAILEDPDRRRQPPPEF